MADDNLLYKLRKEDFVSNLHGTNISTLLCTVSVLPLAYAMTISMNLAASKYCLPFYRSLRFALEFFILCGASLVSVSSVVGFFDIAVLVACTSILWIAVTHVPNVILGVSHDRSRASSAHEGDIDLLRSAITAYRGCIMLMTCVAILGVDFPVFLRAHAKTEAYGASLMDLGVGSVVMASSMTSRAARGEPVQESLLATLSPIALPILLGAVRLFSHSAVQYQHHVSEYGTQWNFYWTIGFLALLMAVLQAVGRAAMRLWYMCLAAVGQEERSKTKEQSPAVSAAREAVLYAMAGCVVALAYQAALRTEIGTFQDVLGCMDSLRLPPSTEPLAGAPAAGRSPSLAPPHTLEAYMLCASRAGGFVAGNRDGIFSTAGYLSMQLFGLAAGRMLVAIRASSCDNKPAARQMQLLAMTSAGVAVVAWGVYFLMTDPCWLLAVERAVADLPLPLPIALPSVPGAWTSPPSRRLANAPYVALCVAMNATQLCVYAATGMLAAWAIARKKPQNTHLVHVKQGTAAVSRSRTSTVTGENSENMVVRKRRGNCASPAASLSLGDKSSPMRPSLIPSGFHEPQASPHGGSGVEHPALSLLLEAVNAYFFPFFLLGNLLTGLVNATVRTLDSGAAAALTILSVYLLTLTSVAVYGLMDGVTLKLKI